MSNLNNTVFDFSKFTWSALSSLCNLTVKLVEVNAAAEIFVTSDSVQC